MTGEFDRSGEEQGASPNAPPVQQGEEVDLEVLRLGFRGEGVARHEGFTVFVPGALPGELIRARIGRVRARYADAELLSIVEPSQDRVEPPCAVYGECGGCQLQHMTYEAQLRFKGHAVADALIHLGRFAPETVSAAMENVRGMSEPWRYRNKVAVAAVAREGKFVAGFVEEGTHEPVSAEQCLIRPEFHDVLVRSVVEVLGELHIEPYDERARTGHVRRISIRTTSTGDAMVIVATADHELPHAYEFARRMDARCPDGIRLAGVVQTVAQPGDRRPAGQRRRTLWGSEYLQEEMFGFRLRVSADSFLQVNPRQTGVLYDLALRQADIRRDEDVFDLYSGVGALTMALAARAKAVYGIESAPGAVADAMYNAEENGVSNVFYRLGSAEREINSLLKSRIRPGVAVLDPPRAGAGPRVLAALMRGEPRRIVYISCDPATLARDLRVLSDSGYRLRRVIPVDMFPQTAHVECVAIMDRLSSSEHS